MTGLKECPCCRNDEIRFSYYQHQNFYGVAIECECGISVKCNYFDDDGFEDAKKRASIIWNNRVTTNTERVKEVDDEST